MTQNIKNQCIFVHKFDIKIAWLNQYGMIFHEQQACVYDFPSQSLATCAKIVFKHSWLCHLCLKTNSNTSAEARVAKDCDGKSYTHDCCSWKVTYSCFE